MTQTHRLQLRDLIFRYGFKRGEFTLASGKTSDFYVDVRSVALSAEGHWLLGRLLFEFVHGGVKRVTPEGQVELIRPDAVAGVELGGCPLASAVSLMSMFEGQLAAHLTNAQPPRAVPALYVRKNPKGHGTNKLIEAPGNIRLPATVLLLEDVITTGGSTIRAAQSLTEAGYDVIGVIVVVDRMEGGRQAIENALSVSVGSIFTRHDFIPLGHDRSDWGGS